VFGTDGFSITPGDKAEMSCLTLSSAPTKWRWFRGSTEVLDKANKFVLTPSRGLIEVIQVDEPDAGMYICKNDGTSPPESANVTLYVGAFVTNGTARDVDKGTTLVVDCIAYGYPAPGITWYFNDKAVQADGTHYTTSDIQTAHNNLTLRGGRLTVKSAQTADSGVYTCNAKNTFGDRNGTTSIHVKGACAAGRACADTCVKRGMQCCSCSGSTTQTCTCCPKSAVCCAAAAHSSPSGGVSGGCCPEGSLCTADGRCAVTTYLAPTAPLTDTRRYCSGGAGAATVMSITVDNSFQLYLDGSLVSSLPHSDDWTQIDHVTIPANTQLIAVQGTNNELVAGILASSADHSILTNSTWRCVHGASRYETEGPSRGWTDPAFDDSTWPAAAESWRNQATPWWGSIGGIDREAAWIWTNFPSGSEGWHERVYCRLRLCTQCVGGH
jgi:hypothetical protein